MVSLSREFFPKGKDKYGQALCTNQFRLAAFYTENVQFFHKTSYFDEEVNRTEPFSKGSLV